MAGSTNVKTVTEPNGSTTTETTSHTWTMDLHEHISNWLSHVETIFKTGTWASLAYAAYEFARHLI